VPVVPLKSIASRDSKLYLHLQP